MRTLAAIVGDAARSIVAAVTYARIAARDDRNSAIAVSPSSSPVKSRWRFNTRLPAVLEIHQQKGQVIEDVDKDELVRELKASNRVGLPSSKKTLRRCSSP